MTREEEIIARAEEAEKETTFSDIVLKAKGVCSAYGIGFLEGAKWADENPDERMIAKFLSEKKGYPIDLNGNLPSFEETMKDVEKYNKYKEDKLIERAAEWLAE